ncbi:MAG: tetratricopeptide repeat protein [Telmatospirillum sp.]|nr:tetratricopeptide repeat protein [Telmatospirillum sp.]
MDIAPLFAAALSRHGDGAPAEALAAYREILKAVPDAGGVWLASGLALQDMASAQTARRAFLRALALDPGSTAARGALAGLLLAAGEASDALIQYRLAIMGDPLSADLHNNLGNTLGALGRREEAARAFRQAIALAPAAPQPYANLAALLIDADHPREAIPVCRRALVIRPSDPGAWNNLGTALMETGADEAALSAFRRALALAPDFAAAAVNLSAALIDLGDIGGAVRLCRNGITLQPGDAASYNNLGNALRADGRLPQAEQVFSRALRLAPGDAEIHYNMSSVLLKMGRFAEGWREFEWRRLIPRSPFRRHPLPGPAWDGGPLNGRTLLIDAEQGLGDVLQFARYAPVIAANAGGTVLLRVYPALIRLMRGLPGLGGVVSTDGALPAYDCHIPLMSLAGMTGAGTGGAPVPVPYLTADPGLADAWRQRLEPSRGRRVGLVWAGAPRPEQRGAHLLDRRRSMSLALFHDVLRIGGIQWISLQKGEAAAATAGLPPDVHVFDAMSEVRDFADTAALVSVLDLVIAVDTSVAHLAGALGKPVWLLSRFDGCWRWLEGEVRSPWYPTMRVFHQTARGDWASVVITLGAALRRWRDDGRDEVNFDQ